MTLPVTHRRKLLFTPCSTKAHFQLWVRTFLDIELPECVVVEESNSNPLDAAWEYYDRLLRNDLVGCSRVMTYANRGGFKTLSAAILETMALLHTERNIGHMAAIEAQSKKSASYIKDFFRREVLRDFVVGDNSREIRLVRFTNSKTGEVVNETEYLALPVARQGEYVRRDNYLKIVVCTMAGANSDHVEFFVVDEVDVVPKQNVSAYFQAQNIPDPRDGLLPLTLLTSTRKSRIGLVQKEIDEGEKTGLKVKHWNLVDVTEACKPARHHPELPRSTYYVNDDQVKHVTQEEFDAMNPGQQKKWYPVDGFSGCRGCRLFAACKGRLATHQKSTSAMLKPIEFAIEKFASAPTPDFISTEYLCRKPDASGLVYPRINREIHWKLPSEMAEMVMGEFSTIPYNKSSLIALLKSKGAQFYAGMDFGFTHNFAVVVVAVYAQNVFILDCYSQAGLELDEQVANCEYLKTIYGNPLVYPDPAYPGHMKTFHKRGFRIKDWDKKPHSVKAGIEIVRALLWSAKGVARMFFLKDDPGVELLLKHMEAYKFKVDATGTPTEEPDEDNDDEPDSLRYVIMNALGSKGAIRDNSGTAVKSEATALAQPSYQPGGAGKPQEWMQDLIRQHTGQAEPAAADQPTSSVKRGRFIWDG